MKGRLLLLSILLSLFSEAQLSNYRIVVDNQKRFVYSDSAGVTPSYIVYFGENFPVPDIITLDGKSITQADLKGKTIVYNFWFVQCRPCVAEIPALNRLVKKYASDTVLFIAITFDKADRIKEFLQKHEFTFQITSLPQSKVDSIKKISFYPFTAIVNKEGKLSYAIFSRQMGKNPDEEVFNLLDKQVTKAIHQ